MVGKSYIGTSGWNYPHWGDGVFYPRDLPQKKWLLYYCEVFNTVEVNSTFYHLPAKKVFENWKAKVPDNFLFIVKANRFITHIKKLGEPEVSTSKFLENTSGLGGKLGPILFQLPPSLNLDLTRLEQFLDYLAEQEIIPNLQVAFEIRNHSWKNEEVFSLFKKHNIALCFADWPKLTIESPITADFVYIRRHGPETLYASNYTQEQLGNDAEKIKNWLNEGKDIFLYFNNDAFGYAIECANKMKELLSS